MAAYLWGALLVASSARMLQDFGGGSLSGAVGGGAAADADAAVEAYLLPD